MKISVVIPLGLLMISHSLPAQTVSLDGMWEFAVDSSARFSSEDVSEKALWRAARVPLSWQAQFSDLRDYQGIAWYKTSFTIAKNQSTDIILLHFNAVDYLTKVFVNGRYAGTHEGGFTPFEFDITKLVRQGVNELLVRVIDPVGTEQGTEGISYWHIPHGKQSWYIQTSGIWQSVGIRVKPKVHITSVHVTPSIDGTVAVDVSFNRRGNRKLSQSLDLNLLDPHGKNVLHQVKKIDLTDERARFQGHVKNPMLWSFTSPNLYRVELSLGKTDTVVERFGFRSIEAKNQLLYLNGQPFYLIGALDQDFYPGSIYSTPSEEYLRDEMMKAKELGLNTLRCHIKVPDPRYLKVADEVGLLVWYEIPNWDIFTPEAGKRALATFDEMLERDWNHPSLVIVSLINESWGVDLQNPDHRSWLTEAFRYAKQKAVGRLIVDNSACWGNFHLQTDINDFHTYWAIPENRHRFDQIVTEIAQRPSWLFSPFGDAEEKHDEPLIMSEFGNWGLPILPHDLPWWFDRDFLGRGVTLPKGVHQRFNLFRYNEIFDTYDQLALESQWAQFEALKYEIEQLRLTGALQGYVVTEFTDVNWESNGLLDMWRNVKIYGEHLTDIQQQDLIIPRPTKYNYWSDETVEIKLWITHYSSLDINHATVDWSLSSGERGSIEVPQIGRTEVKEISPLKFSVESTRSQQRLRVSLLLTAQGGSVVARNYCDVFLYPRRFPQNHMDLRVYDPLARLSKLRQSLEDVGYRITERDMNNSLTMTDVLDEVVLERLGGGNTVVCLVDSITRLPEKFPLQVINREMEWYDGNWASNLNWVRDDRQPFRSVNFGKRLGLEAAAVVPRYVIENIPPEYFSDALAGMFVGWLHLNSAYLFQMNVGKGKLFLCTLRLAEAIDNDPYAATLLNALVKSIEGNECTPLMTWKR